MSAARRLISLPLLYSSLSLAFGCTAERDARPPDETQPAGAAICEDADTPRAMLRSVCDYYMERPIGSDAIFVAGYACRTLAAGSAILDDPRYLGAAVGWADELLAKQDSTGYWTTGYSKHYYLADTGSALGLLFALAPRVDGERRARYEFAVARYVNAVEADGLVTPSGALGTGWRFDEERQEHLLYPDEYTISSSLTGAQVFTWMYTRTREPRYLEIAYRALRWILSTVRGDGVVPYVLAGEGADLGVTGDPENDRMMWDSWRYNTAGYVGEGLIAFHAHCDRAEWRAEIEAGARPIVAMLVRTQNADGTWAEPGSGDQKRSPGVVNLLAWYYANVEPDPAVRDAICRFVDHLRGRESAVALGIQNAGAEVNHPNAIITSLTGRALAAVIEPGVDVRW